MNKATRKGRAKPVDSESDSEARSDAASGQESADQNGQSLDFEAALDNLEQLVERLESGELGLAESLAHFEQGIGLSRQCHAMIDAARQKVSLLTNPDDEASAVDFNLESSEKSD